MNGFPITAIHQVEITSRCNLRCKYCPSPKLARPKVDMDERVYKETVRWAKIFVERGTQYEFNLHGIGESTIHPKFVEWTAYAREQLGPRVNLTLATNGVAVTQEMVDALKPLEVKVWVSLHRPEKAGPAVEMFKKAGMLCGVSADPALAAIDWAGQVDWHVSHAPMKCAWIDSGKALVMADGRVTTCGLDASGIGVVGNIFDDVFAMRLRPYGLCAKCTHTLSPAAAALTIGEAA